MAKEKELDLSELLGDTLNLHYSVAMPARYITEPNPKPEEKYYKIVNRDPYEVLGERKFERKEKKMETIVGTPIQEFYRGTNVFITGATGFVGKMLTEKLIRSVPHIGHVYLLIRGKKGKSCQERYEQLLEDKLFARMKAEVPDFASKLTAVDGDLSSPGLGLSPSARRELLDRVHVVFHSAADVRFIEPLRTAVTNNVLGSRRVLELAKEMEHLRSYVHVSTAYSQCVRRIIEENVPTMNINYKDILAYIESKSDEELKEETPRIMQGWPNTYTFSKALCEEMLKEEAIDLPFCIFRPSVVTPTCREPVRGWTDNLYGPTGLLTGAAHGAIHCFRIDEELGLDTVPVDYVVNCMLAVAWKIADEKYRSRFVIPVYNFAYTSLTPGYCWKNTVEFSLTIKEIFPFSRAVWYTSYFSTKNYYVMELMWYLLHRIPGACFDKLAELTGGKPGLTKIYKRIENLKDQTNYFAFRQWTFKSDNVLDLWNSLRDDDKEIFYFDVRDIDLREYFLVCKLGVRYYYLKEKMEDIPKALQKNTWLYWLHNSVKLTCSLLALKLLVVTANALPF